MHRILSGSLSVERPTIEVTRSPESLERTRLVQLSDLYYDGLRLSEETLAAEMLAEEMLVEAIAPSNHAKLNLVVLTH